MAAIWKGVVGRDWAAMLPDLGAEPQIRPWLTPPPLLPSSTPSSIVAMAHRASLHPPRHLITQAPHPWVRAWMGRAGKDQTDPGPKWPDPRPPSPDLMGETVKEENGGWILTHTHKRTEINRGKRNTGNRRFGAEFWLPRARRPLAARRAAAGGEQGHEQGPLLGVSSSRPGLPRSDTSLSPDSILCF